MQPKTSTEVFVSLKNTPGTLAKATEAIGKQNVNITGFLCNAEGDTGIARFVTNDPTKTEEALKSAGLKPQRREVLLAPIENTPGQLGRIAKQLGQSGVNIEASFPVVGSGGETQICFDVDDIQTATKVLSG